MSEIWYVFTKDSRIWINQIPDVIICEDEPYYCLVSGVFTQENSTNPWWQSQYTGEWTPKGAESEMSILARRRLKTEKENGPDGNQAFLDALPPSFLAFDTDGRVIRMDVSANRLDPRLQWCRLSPRHRHRAPDWAGSQRRPFSSNVWLGPRKRPPRLRVDLLQHWQRRWSNNGGLTATFAGCEALRLLTTCAKHGFVTLFKMSFISSLTVAMTCSPSVRGPSLAIQSNADHCGTRNVVYAALR